MFHVNAWGIPYGCAMTGAKLVLPGPRYEGDMIFELLDDEKVTITAGVPTVWMMLAISWYPSGLFPRTSSVRFILAWACNSMRCMSVAGTASFGPPPFSEKQEYICVRGTLTLPAKGLRPSAHPLSTAH